MSNGIEIRSNEGGYETRAYDFELMCDLYLFFKFESPKSNCEIGIAYDCLVSEDEWFVNDGEFAWSDSKIVDDVIFTKLYENEKFALLRSVIHKAIEEFNRKE